MFHRIRDVNFVAINSRFFQRLIHYFPGRSNKRFTLLIFVIARLLADQHDRRVLRAFAEDGLGRVFVEVAAGADARFLQQRFP